jgi:hypothetical protein
LLPKLYPEVIFELLFEESKELKRQLKRLQAARRGTRKAEPLLSTEVNIITSYDQGE